MRKAIADSGTRNAAGGSLQLSPQLLHILQHSLGADEYGRIPMEYRNHFCTDGGTTDFMLCRQLVAIGLMKDHGERGIAGGMFIFSVTNAGRKAMRDQSPPPPKLSKGQERYRRYLEADGYFPSFREFLRHETEQEKEALCG